MVLKLKIFLTAMFQEVIYEQKSSLPDSRLVSHVLAPEKVEKKGLFSVAVSKITRRFLQAHRDY